MAKYIKRNAYKWAFFLCIVLFPLKPTSDKTKDLITAIVIIIKTPSHNINHNKPAILSLGIYLKKYDNPAKKENNDVIKD